MRGLKILLLIIACFYMVYLVYIEGFTTINSAILLLLGFTVLMNIWQGSKTRKDLREKEQALMEKRQLK